MIVPTDVSDNECLRSDEPSFAAGSMIGQTPILWTTPSRCIFLRIVLGFEKGGSSILYHYTFPFVDEIGHFIGFQIISSISYKLHNKMALWLYLFFKDCDCDNVCLWWQRHLEWLQRIYNWRISSWSISIEECYSHPARDWCNRSPNHRLTLGRVYPCGLLFV